MNTPSPDLVLGAESEGPRVFDFVGGEVALLTRRSPQPKRINEDGVLAIDLGDGLGVLAVADGMGGAPQGDLAAAITLESLSKSILAWVGSERPLRSAILDGIESANDEVLTRMAGSGATLAIGLLDEGEIRSLHVGDAAMVVCGQRGKLKHETWAHSPVGYAQQAGMLSEDEALLHAERHVISNAVGSPSMHIEVGPSIPLAEYDTAVIGSDGLFDNLRIEELVDCVRCGSLLGAAEQLDELVAARMAAPALGRLGKPDDCSFLLFRPQASKR